MEVESPKVALLVPKRHVKTVKSALERAGKLDRTSRIAVETSEQLRKSDTPKPEETPAQNSEGEETGPQRDSTIPNSNNQNVAIDNNSSETQLPMGMSAKEQRMRIPTTFNYLVSIDGASSPANSSSEPELRTRILEDLDLSWLNLDITVIQHTSGTTNANVAEKNPLRKALKEALENLPDTTLESLQLTSAVLTSDFPESYSIYPPMLLLPHNAFTTPSWQTLLSTHSPECSILQPIWARIASALGMTHIAINSPIPASTTNDIDSAHPSTENILRSPINITPLYNSFGPNPTPQTLTHPTPADFTAGFWATTTQNGIHQTWAPMYTMFSRGNIREKTRILNLPSVTQEGCGEGGGVGASAAVDMYAGIGYFAFSYMRGGGKKKKDKRRKEEQGKRENERQSYRSGIETVFCFEINPWSVEGLRRGAEKNGWTVQIFKEEDLPTNEDAEWKTTMNDNDKKKKKDFYIFQCSNERALEILTSQPFKTLGLHIRHVNLGLLPTSRLAWRSAAGIVDAERGGWVHVHENVGVGEIEERKREVEGEFKRFVDGWGGGGGGGGGQGSKVCVEHVERVKLYAPGVYHCVFDVRIDGMWECRKRGCGY